MEVQLRWPHSSGQHCFSQRKAYEEWRESRGFRWDEGKPDCAPDPAPESPAASVVGCLAALSGYFDNHNRCTTGGQFPCCLPCTRTLSGPAATLQTTHISAAD